MRFFKPRRRKLGVLTLLIACVFMIGWGRSFVMPKYIGISRDSDTLDRLVSRQGNIDWERFHHEGVTPLNQYEFATAILLVDKDKSRNLAWKWQYLGCGEGEYQGNVLDRIRSSNPVSPFGKMTHSIWRIPYCLITIPLNLVSAFLLLSKPPSTTKPKPAPSP